MRQASVYRVPARSSSITRDQLVYERLECALTLLVDLDRCHVGDVASFERLVPGLTLVDDGKPVIALGREAYVALSSVRKRSLIACDLDLTGACGDDVDREIETLVWSSVNTIRLVALGLGAWQSAQLLPVGDRRQFHVPPLQACPADEESPSVLIISHEQHAAARRVALALADAGIPARLTAPSADLPDVPPDAAWSDPAWIHVHVGTHTLDADEMRLVDSWHSDRVALELTLPSGPMSSGATALTITDQANGFVCQTPAEIVAICRDLIDDPILRHRLIGFGRNSVVMPLKDWDVIATDLLA